MAIFFLSKQDPSGPPHAWLEAHAHAGFGRRMSLKANDWVLWLWGKLDGSGPHYVSTGPDFAACTGIFFYRGERQEDGLKRLLEDFDGRTFPWFECRGHYAVILFKHGRLYLASDELGAYKIYRNLDGTRFSSSFSALRALLPSAEPDTQGLYEYVLNGATFGEKTLARHVKQQREGVLYAFREAGPPETTVAPLRPAGPPPRTLDEAAEEYAGRLRALFKIYTGGCRRFKTALSGGYDSRLILALLLDAGIDPALFVYGSDGDPDVRVAQEIARGEGLRLEQIDKKSLERTRKAPDELAWARFDSWNYCGLFDNGVDAVDREERTTLGVDLLNGGGGECLRNFFYLREGRYRPEEIVWTFYSQYHPHWLTGRFQREEYVAELAEDMRRALPGCPRDTKLERSEVEGLYPRFRVRYWTGRDAGLNQRFGPLLLPFLEPEAFTGTEGIPLAFKDHGRLEARIIRRIAPRLATYRSAYGFPLSAEPPLRYRMKMSATYWRPSFLRQFSYRFRTSASFSKQLPSWWGPALAFAGGQATMSTVQEFFRVERISRPEVLNRIMSAAVALNAPPPLQWTRAATEDPGSQAHEVKRAA